MSPPRSTETSTAAGGTTAAERKLTPDLARGVMLLLIAMAYAGVYAGVGFGAQAGQLSTPDTVSRFLTTLNLLVILLFT